MATKYTVSLVIAILALAGAYYIYAPKAKPERERMVEMTIPNFHWVGTPKDARYLRVKVPDWAELVVGVPEVLDSIEEGRLSSAQIPFLRSPNGAELMIGVGYIYNASGSAGESESTPAEKESRIGRWEGSVIRESGLGITMIRFHVLAGEEGALGGVCWREGNDEAAREAEVLLDSVLKSVQQAHLTNAGSPADKT